MKFQIVHSDGGQVFIRLKASNGETVLVGETQHNVVDALQTIMNIKGGAANAVVEEIDGRKRTLAWSPDNGLGPLYDSFCPGTCDTNEAPHFHTLPQT